MSRLPLSTELGLAAFILLFPIWAINPVASPIMIMILLVVQLGMCIGSLVARHKEKDARRVYLQGIIDKIKKNREGK
tara:strand:- start:1019 stop:1249 length:231 start_codon:yes stop_codon:yes gene_type:complete